MMNNICITFDMVWLNTIFIILLKAYNITFIALTKHYISQMKYKLREIYAMNLLSLGSIYSIYFSLHYCQYV